jgi:hypothetical protein
MRDENDREISLHWRGSFPENRRLQKRFDALYSTLRSEFLNYAVGPWVSVARREAALARGNPAGGIADLRFPHFRFHKIDNGKIDNRKIVYASSLRSFRNAEDSHQG